MNLLAQFTYLQLLDALTTIAFMMQGVGESNPLVRWVMRATADSITGLFLLKAVGVVLAIVCFYRSRERLLRRVNVFFAGLVVYNLLALILANPLIN